MLAQQGFANPIGQNFRQAMDEIITGLAADRDRDSFRGPLDRIVRILAVQEMPAGMAFRFLFLLRRLLEAERTLSANEKRRLSERLDELAELAAEIWAGCRETLATLRVEELRGRIRRLETGHTPKDRGGSA